MQLELDIPATVMAYLERLRAAGGSPLLVGGCVRDALLAIASNDFDVATSLRPDELARVVPGVDRRFGAAHAALDNANLTVTSFRRDGRYVDQRRPSEVSFVASAQEDSARRDFTINAIYADPWTGRIIDPCGGCRDLEARVLRVIGNPRDRLREDPLRLLRGVRFAARFDLGIETETESAIRTHAEQLAVLSHERVFAELTDAFTGPGRGRALRMLVELGLAEHVLPEVVAMPGVPQPPEFHPEGDVFVHVCLVLDRVSPRDPVQAWTAVLHDVGKPATFERAADRIRFNGHDVLSAEMADVALRRFHAPRELRETVVEVCRDHIRFATIPQMKRHRLERWMRSPRFAAHLEFHRADCQGSHNKLDIYEMARNLWIHLPPLPPPPLCSGADVRALGVPEGPVIGEILRDLEKVLVIHGVSDRDAALEQLREIVEERFSGLG